MTEQNIYLFYGTENFLINDSVNLLIDRLIPEEERELNVITYDLLNSPIEQVVEEAETLPFFSNHKLIIAKNAYLFTGQKVKSVDHSTDSLERLLEQPLDYSTIIFWVPYEKLDERKKIVKLIKKQGQVKVYNALSGTSLIDWVKKLAAKEEVEITEKAIKQLVYLVGQNLQLLSKELSKMATYVGKNGIVDEGVVNLLGARTTEQNIFTLIESVASLRIEEAFRLFYDLLQNKEEPIKMVALFSRQFRLMLFSKELNRLGYSQKQIASQLAAHPYAIKLALEQSTKFTAPQLEDIVKKIAEIDYSVKTGKIDKVLSLEMFMFYLKGQVS